MARLASGLSLPVLLVGLCFVLRVSAVTCYHLDGSNGGASDAPCDSNATGEAGSHSACCDVANSDACLSSGLCLNTAATGPSHVLWSTGCTDETFQDPACPKWCLNMGMDNAHLAACNSTHWCCEADENEVSLQECCDSAFDSSESIGTVVAQLVAGTGAVVLPTASASSSAAQSETTTTSSSSTGLTAHTAATPPSTSMPTGAIAGLVVEGVVLAATIVALGFIAWRNRSLRKKIKAAEEAGAAAAAAASAAGVAHQLLQRQLQEQIQYASGVAQYGYGVVPDIDAAKSNELSTINDPRELEGTELTMELPSSVRSPASARSPRNPE
ncbi:hypothetical protein GGR56DRAFT_546024 [Xylariaceae sp. FL0804]|nr:hypothetical protein GGR56DRAFT_546024 [Xylariaceae sp. FL0804]